VIAGRVRLSGGELRGRVVPVPPGVRPTEGRVREALFSILGPAVCGASFLDLFAGCGAVGLEAASRGAGRVLQVDGAATVVRDLQRTVGALWPRGITVVRLDLPRQLDGLEAGRFDWAFADPPYAFAAYDELLAALPRLLAPGGTAIVEHDVRRALPATVPGLELATTRRYGESALSFYRPPGSYRPAGLGRPR
jgi:16S rRNA (guanine(966)-N(2))-methyltransferase RsmD